MPGPSQNGGPAAAVVTDGVPIRFWRGALGLAGRERPLWEIERRCNDPGAKKR
jgi:hypothetical protein